MKAYRKAFGPAVILVLFVVAGFTQAATWNVPGDSATIQGGIDLAAYGDTVHVATGTYNELITLENGVALIGASAATTTIDGNTLSGSVVSSTGCDPNTALEGFTITNGLAEFGGGMYNNNSSPTVTNCIFSDNIAGYNGGGMYNNYSSLAIINCTFSGNEAYGDGGGGMFNVGSSSTVTGCTFTGNWGGAWGGGIFGYYSNLTMTNCTFTGNTADKGGGIYNLHSSPMVTNCTFSQNAALQTTGGGISNIDESSPNLTNCILWGNTAPIFAQIYNDSESSTTITYSDVEGGYPGAGNIDADPQFIDADGANNIPGTEDDKLRLQAD